MGKRGEAGAGETQECAEQDSTATSAFGSLTASIALSISSPRRVQDENPAKRASNPFITALPSISRDAFPKSRGLCLTCKAHRFSLVDLEDLGKRQRVPEVGLGPLGPELDAFQGVLEALQSRGIKTD